jgi:hypothetical protein
MQLREAYARHGLTFADLVGPRFLRVKRVQQLQEMGRLDEHLRLRTTLAGER